MRGDLQEEEFQKLVRNAVIYLRRGDLNAAESNALAALDLNPEDPAAVELMGDVLLGKGDREAALAQYKKSVELSPENDSAELKYARLVLDISEDAYEKEHLETRAAAPAAPVSKSAVGMAFLASVIWPGLGQWRNGDIIKAVILACVYGFCVMALYFTGAFGPMLNMWLAVSSGGQGPRVNPNSVGLFTWLIAAGGAAAWLYAVLDAPLVASRGVKKSSDSYTEPDF